LAFRPSSQLRRLQLFVRDGEIPSPPPYFLGREDDITAILNVLLSPAPARAILIQGARGIGKTALTKAVSCHTDVIERFGEANRWFVVLDTATTAALMQDAITRTLGADPQSGFKATLAAYPPAARASGAGQFGNAMGPGAGAPRHRGDPCGLGCNSGPCIARFFSWP